MTSRTITLYPGESATIGDTTIIVRKAPAEPVKPAAPLAPILPTPQEPLPWCPSPVGTPVQPQWPGYGDVICGVAQ